jgi:hypothetical protein
MPPVVNLELAESRLPRFVVLLSVRCLRWDRVFATMANNSCYAPDRMRTPESVDKQACLY